jgi:dipeptidyl aminopeptidase/acylaminoacyl peptidase
MAALGYAATLLAMCLCAPGHAAAPGHGAAPGGPMADLMQATASLTDFREAAISPDHRYVAWVQAVSAGDAVAVGSALYIQPLDRSTPPLQVSAKPLAKLDATAVITERAVAWAADSKSLAFLSDAQSPGQMQLYVMRTADRAVRLLTHLKGLLATPRWSADGRTLALLYTENAVRAAGPLAAVAPAVGVVDEQIDEQRLMTVDVATGDTKLVSPKDLYVYEYDWSPHGDRLVATAAHGSGDNNWYTAELFTIETATGITRSLLKPDMQIAAPRWSPDGRWIAYVGGLSSDEPLAGGDVFQVSSAGGAARNLTPNLKGTAYSLTWHTDSRTIFVALDSEGETRIAKIDNDSGTMKIVWQGPETVRAPPDLAFGFSLASDGKTSAVIRESFNEPPSLWAGEIGRWSPFKMQSSPVPWGKAESIRWKSDEFDVQGWLVPPAHIDPTRQYPMVVWIHGGPAWVSVPSFPTQLSDSPATLLAARGYFVFYPNPRGSAGSGERFERANIKDFGGGDLRDILAGIRQIVATHPIDDDRVGLTGWSYGGYMTMWAITQTPRFRAAVVRAGLSDWLSYYGENGIDEWMIPYFGASVYDDPAVYAKSSPINFIKQVRTPTLLLVGDGDVECPPPQSYEYWHALRTLNVKTQLVVYPGEGHRFMDPVHARDLMERMLAWFDDNMPSAAR